MKPGYNPVINYQGINVKREDLCGSGEAPGLFKLRGLFRLVEDTESQFIGIVDGPHSRNGWALAYVCNRLDRRAIVFWPKRKSMSKVAPLIAEGLSRNNARIMGATIVPLQAARSTVMNARAREYMERFNSCEMVPPAVRLEQTVEEYQKVIESDQESIATMGSVIIPVGTGTWAAGILRGMNKINASPKVFLHLSYHQNHSRLVSYIEKASGVSVNTSTVIVDELFSHNSKLKARIPFPACSYHEAKAWDWMIRNRKQIREPIWFWNGGDDRFTM